MNKIGEINTLILDNNEAEIRKHPSCMDVEDEDDLRDWEWRELARKRINAMSNLDLLAEIAEVMEAQS